MIDVIIPYGNIENNSLRRYAFLKCISSIDCENFNIIISDISTESEYYFIKENINHNFIYLYNKNPSPFFNKSFSINRGFELVNSNFFLICDADIIFSKKIIFEDSDILKFKINYCKIENEKLIESLQCSYNKYLGGIFGITKKSFIDIGGFNENFFGWGHEDSEFTGVIEHKKIKITNSSTVFYTIKLDISDFELEERKTTAARNHQFLKQRLN